MAKYPSQLQDKFNLRLPDGMKDIIAERAKANGRSMNSEIVQILEDALYDMEFVNTNQSNMFTGGHTVSFKTNDGKELKFEIDEGEMESAYKEAISTVFLRHMLLSDEGFDDVKKKALEYIEKHKKDKIKKSVKKMNEQMQEIAEKEIKK
ncbi:Arc family DNA-binding protein [Providencia rettgeri]|uniref:Arc family DNA-binding protein n=1 Tax=Providencia rettgeri TaxID=587 RepID=UPI001FFB83CE|nr:Arc family DNA-binding protein [Providencia rettgeri]MDR9615307.1 Arc family DNA-binding protein [Providencia rettgeri]